MSSVEYFSDRRTFVGVANAQQSATLATDLLFAALEPDMPEDVTFTDDELRQHFVERVASSSTTVHIQRAAQARVELGQALEQLDGALAAYQNGLVDSLTD